MLVQSLLDTNPALCGSFAGAVKTAAPSRRRQIVDIITLAFAVDPAARWVYPTAQQYLEYFPNFIRLFGGRALETGTAYYIENFTAAALWLPPGITPDETGLMSLLESTAAPEIREDLLAVFEQMGKFHPNEPHWYLPMIGVDPAQQGKGYGSMLLRHALAACDRDRLPAYLESSNPRNVPLYEYFGFETIGTIQCGSSPPIIPMRREPQRRGSFQNN
jgi:ribosomal protein S18 acetylase RimI-like enzyme